MKTLRQNMRKALTAILMATPFLAFAVPASAQVLRITPGATLKQRVMRPKPAKTVINVSKARVDVVVVKFREGTRIRESLGQLQADLANLSAAEDRLLQRANLPRQQLFQELAQVNTLVSPNTNRFVRKLFSRSEAELDADKSAGEVNTGEELADLNLYHRILIRNATASDTERLIDQLNALDIVEIAYPEPIPQVAQADIAPTTPNFTSSQGYLAPAATGTSTTNGIDVNYARFFPGARGNDVQIIDVESGWNLSHEDLPPVFFNSGVNNNDAVSHQHGTSVLGVMAAAENTFGMTGIAPQSRVGVSSELDESCIFGFCWQTVDLPDAINKATAALRIGDIMLIELHAPGPDSGPTPTSNCNPTQFEFIAMEFWDANFDAIKNATSKGVIVVEAAGNGTMNLDSSIYNGKFDRSSRDSGAIMVGAGTSDGRAPMCFTNFGSRVDVQGWGQNVATLGNRISNGTNMVTGNIQVNGGDQNQWYTTVFSGTSSATPIVAGAAASLQGFRKARLLAPFTSTSMRDFLKQTGVAQATDTRQIGPLPNLRAAIDAHNPKRTLKVTFLNIKVVDNVFPGSQFETFNFTVNSQTAQFSGTFPQNIATSLPAGFSLTGQEILNGGLTVQVTSALRAVITTNPKTGQITSVWSRPVQVLHFFPTGTTYGTSIFFGGGSQTFTERSNDQSGYFEITYRVEVVNSMVLLP